MLVLMTTISNNIIWSAPKLQQLFIIGKNARTIWLKPFSKMGFRNRHYSWSNYWYNNIPCLASFKIKDYIASFNRNNCRAYFVLISHVVFNEKIFPEKFDYIIMKNHHIIQISKMSLLYHWAFLSGNVHRQISDSPVFHWYQSIYPNITRGVFRTLPNIYDGVFSWNS